jgi:serine/threonine protein kinase
MSGTRWDAWGSIEIRQLIGQGSHGVVFQGFQEELNRFVAVKMMAPHLATEVAARKRFAREARAAAAIVHPKVMPILLVDSSGQFPYLVMPYVDSFSVFKPRDSP